MAFSFPVDKADFTAPNGITYSWDTDDEKWVVAGFGADSDKLIKYGDDVTDATENVNYKWNENLKLESVKNITLKAEAIAGAELIDRTISETSAVKQIANKQYVDAQDAILQNEIVELEEEIDAITPSVERGTWAFNLGGLASSRGQLSMYDDNYSSVGSPIGIFKSAKSIWLNEEDNAGTPHGFDNVEAGNLLELFVEGEPDYGLFDVVDVHDETNGAASWWVIEVNFVRALSDTSLASNGDNIRVKIFQAPTGGDASEILKYVDDRLVGVVGRYVLKDVANNPVSSDGHMGISTSFASNINQLSFGAKDLDGGVTKQLTDGDIIETFDAANNKNNRFKVTDASNAPSVVKVEFVSGNGSYIREDVYQVQIYPGSEEAGSSLIQVLPGNPADPQVGDAWFSTNQNTFIIKIS